VLCARTAVHLAGGARAVCAHGEGRGVESVRLELLREALFERLGACHDAVVQRGRHLVSRSRGGHKDVDGDGDGRGLRRRVQARHLSDQGHGGSARFRSNEHRSAGGSWMHDQTTEVRGRPTHGDGDCHGRPGDACLIGERVADRGLLCVTVVVDSAGFVRRESRAESSRATARGKRVRAKVMASICSASASTRQARSAWARLRWCASRTR
jgi:hypothetical protein